MTTPRAMVIAVVVLFAGCAAPASKKPPASGSPKGERVFVYHDCMQIDRVLMCTNRDSQPEGTACACVDRKRITGESYSLLGVPN